VCIGLADQSPSLTIFPYGVPQGAILPPKCQAGAQFLFKKGSNVHSNNHQNISLLLAPTMTQTSANFASNRKKIPYDVCQYSTRLKQIITVMKLKYKKKINNSTKIE
jgi:hypothetical protein